VNECVGRVRVQNNKNTKLIVLGELGFETQFVEGLKNGMKWEQKDFNIFSLGMKWDTLDFNDVRLEGTKVFRCFQFRGNECVGVFSVTFSLWRETCVFI